MKQLSEYKDTEGIVKASQILSIIMTILSNDKNMAMKNETNPFVMFSTFMENSPEEMKRIFAILSDTDPKEYHCDGAEALQNMLVLANDSIIVQLFISQRQTGDAKSSASRSENTEE